MENWCGKGRRRDNAGPGVKRLPLKIVWSVAVGRDDWVTLKIVENDAAAIIKLRSMASQLRRVISKRVTGRKCSETVEGTRFLLSFGEEWCFPGRRVGHASLAETRPGQRDG